MSEKTKIAKTDIRTQQWERRGTMVYGEDSGPGTAQFVADYPTMIEAQWAVDSHNKNLAEGSA